MSLDPFERKEELIEIVQAGADLGMYEDVAVSEPSDDLIINNSYVDLPTLDFPSYEEASEIYDNAIEELNKARRLGNKDDIKKMVSNAKRANFTRRNSFKIKMEKLIFGYKLLKLEILFFKAYL